jgi:hypothetical protein
VNATGAWIGCSHSCMLWSRPRRAAGVTEILGGALDLQAPASRQSA